MPSVCLVRCGTSRPAACQELPRPITLVQHTAIRALAETLVVVLSRVLSTEVTALR